MGLGFLLSLLPEDVLPLILVGGGMAVIIGLLSPKTLLSFVGVFLLFTLLSPFIEEFISGLGLWWQVLILGFLALAILRGFFGLLLGGRAGDALVARLASHLLRLPFRMVRGLFPMATWSLREPRL